MWNKVFKTPTKFTYPNVKHFLSEVGEIFTLKDKKISNVLFDVSNIQKIDLLGQLLLYKFVEYSIVNNCFDKPRTNLANHKYLKKELEKTGFIKLVEAFMRQRISDEGYSALTYKTPDRFFIAPMKLQRGVGKESVEMQYSQQICEFYKDSSRAQFVALQSMGEVASNFIEHAVNDTTSVLVASGDHKRFEIACVDTGDGIISTLKKHLLMSANTQLTPYDVLQKAISKGITSKKNSNHMGYGLWLLNQMVSASSGELCIYSEGAYLVNHNGKIKKGLCSSWKGTIVYASLPIAKPKVFDSTIDAWKSLYNDVKIRFE